MLRYIRQGTLFCRNIPLLLDYSIFDFVLFARYIENLYFTTFFHIFLCQRAWRGFCRDKDLLNMEGHILAEVESIGFYQLGVNLISNKFNQTI